MLPFLPLQQKEEVLASRRTKMKEQMTTATATTSITSRTEMKTATTTTTTTLRLVIWVLEENEQKDGRKEGVSNHNRCNDNHHSNRHWIQSKRKMIRQVFMMMKVIASTTKSKKNATMFRRILRMKRLMK